VTLTLPPGVDEEVEVLGVSDVLPVSGLAVVPVGATVVVDEVSGSSVTGIS
jgi:hypothetical protein